MHGLLHSVPGRLVASYSVDESEPVTLTHFNGSQSTDGRFALNSALFNATVAPGDHNLTVKVVEATASQVDYVPPTSKTSCVLTIVVLRRDTTLITSPSPQRRQQGLSQPTSHLNRHQKHDRGLAKHSTQALQLVSQ